MTMRNLICPDCDGRSFAIQFDPDAVANAERDVAEGRMSAALLAMMVDALRSYWVRCATPGCDFGMDAVSVEMDLLSRTD